MTTNRPKAVSDGWRVARPGWAGRAGGTRANEGKLRVPFRVFTKEEEKTLSKNYKSIKKQVDEAFRLPKKK